jgi:hypothetical protein
MERAPRRRIHRAGHVSAQRRRLSATARIRHRYGRQQRPRIAYRDGAGRRTPGRVGKIGAMKGGRSHRPWLSDVGLVELRRPNLLTLIAGLSTFAATAAALNLGDVASTLAELQQRLASRARSNVTSGR